MRRCRMKFFENSKTAKMEIVEMLEFFLWYVKTLMYVVFYVKDYKDKTWILNWFFNKFPYRESIEQKIFFLKNFYCLFFLTSFVVNKAEELLYAWQKKRG